MDFEEENEPQICRLCGQWESIYIDVFSEEGTKRLLDLKIQSKINILIDQKDPLPKAICVQCLGKLEFVCDFQEECLRTQQLLRDQYNLPTPLSEVDENKPPEDITIVNPISTTSTNHQDNTRSNANTNNVNVNGKKISNNNNINDKNLNPLDTEDVVLQENQSDKGINTKLQAKTNRNSNNQQNQILKYFKKVPEQQQQQQQQQESAVQSINDENLSATIIQQPEITTTTKRKLRTNKKHSDILEVIDKNVNKKVKGNSASEVKKRLRNHSNTVSEDGNSNEKVIEVNLVNDVISSNKIKKKKRSLIDKSIDKSDDTIDDDSHSSQKPEELYKMDGKEISVDDNLEQITINNQIHYGCKLCQKVYERKDKCTVHVKTHLGIKQYLCTVCTAKFVCKSDVMKHIRCSHTNPRPVCCPKCPKRFRSKYDLAEHSNVHKGVKPYQCADCDQSYHHKVSLAMHVKSHMPPENLACNYCDKVFPYRTRLLSHIGSVHMKDRRNFRCRFCYNLYSSLSVLNDHVKTRHTTTFSCETCGKNFKVASKYKSHLLQHSNPKPFACEICNNKYASKAFLNEHKLKHQGVRKHVCQKCGAAFAQASHLAAHRHVHEEKTHECPECGKMFNRRDNMKVHRRIHFTSPE